METYLQENTYLTEHNQCRYVDLNFIQTIKMFEQLIQSTVASSFFSQLSAANYRLIGQLDLFSSLHLQYKVLFIRLETQDKGTQRRES